MAIMTQFCPDQKTLYDISFMFISVICLLVFINLSYIGFTIYKKVMRDKKLKKYEERFIAFIEEIFAQEEVQKKIEKERR